MDWRLKSTCQTKVELEFITLTVARLLYAHVQYDLTNKLLDQKLWNICLILKMLKKFAC